MGCELIAGPYIAFRVSVRHASLPPRYVHMQTLPPIQHSKLTHRHSLTHSSFLAVTKNAELSFLFLWNANADASNSSQIACAYIGRGWFSTEKKLTQPWTPNLTEVHTISFPQISSTYCNSSF